MRDLLMLFALIGMIPMILKKPHIGVLLWAWTALLGPNNLMYGIAGSIRYNLLFAILTFVSMIINREKFKFRMGAITAIMFLFVIVTTISTYTAITDAEVVKSEWEKFLKVVVFFVIVGMVMTTRLRLHSLLLIFCISLGFHGFAEALKFLATGGGHHIFGPGKSIIGDNNHFALAMLMLLPLTIYLFRYSKEKVVRVSLIGLFVLLSIAVIGTLSRGGLLGMLAVGGWALLRSNKKFVAIILLVPLFLGLLALAPDKWFDRMDTIEEADQDRSFMGRVISWKMATAVALDHPFFGGGFHAIQGDLDIWLQYSERIHFLDFIPTREPDTKRAHAAHSIYFQVLGDHGFLGLFLFLLILAGAWLNTFHVMRHTQRKPDLKWAGDMAYAVQLSLVAYCVSGAALSMAYFDLSYGLIAVTIILRRIVNQRLATDNARRSF